MGFEIMMMEADWTIPEDKTEEALEKVNNNSDVEYNTLEEAFKEKARYKTELTENGLEIERFTGQKAGWGEEEILSTVSQFVEDGDYVQMDGRYRGDPYRLISKGDRIKTKHAKLVWE